MRLRPLTRHTLLALALSCGPAAALTGDRQQPIHIEADRVTLDQAGGYSLYEGNVHLTQGSLRLNAQRLRVYLADKQLERVVAEGDLATLYQKTDEGGEVNAEARRIEYSARGQTVLLLEQARLWQSGNVFTSERIEYDLVRELVNAGAPDQGERVEVIILPEDAEAQPEPAR